MWTLDIEFLIAKYSSNSLQHYENWRVLKLNLSMIFIILNVFLFWERTTHKWTIRKMDVWGGHLLVGSRLTEILYVNVSVYLVCGCEESSAEHVVNENFIQIWNHWKSSTNDGFLRPLIHSLLSIFARGSHFRLTKHVI